LSFMDSMKAMWFLWIWWHMLWRSKGPSMLYFGSILP
jgi:hypothetical protein